MVEPLERPKKTKGRRKHHKGGDMAMGDGLLSNGQAGGKLQPLDGAVSFPAIGGASQSNGVAQSLQVSEDARAGALSPLLAAPSLPESHATSFPDPSSMNGNNKPHLTPLSASPPVVNVPTSPVVAPGVSQFATPKSTTIPQVGAGPSKLNPLPRQVDLPTFSPAEPASATDILDRPTVRHNSLSPMEDKKKKKKKNTVGGFHQISSHLDVAQPADFFKDPLQQDLPPRSKRKLPPADHKPHERKQKVKQKREKDRARDRDRDRGGIQLPPAI